MQAQSLSSYTIEAIYTLFASLLNTVVDDGLILHNPARGVELPKVEPGPMRILDYDEIAFAHRTNRPARPIDDSAWGIRRDALRRGRRASSRQPQSAPTITSSFGNSQRGRE